MWLIYAALSAGFAALIPLFTKLSAAKIDSVVGTTVRSLIMSAFLIMVSASLRKFDAPAIGSLPYREITFLALSGIAGALSWLCYFQALKIGQVHTVVAIDRLSLLFAALLAVIILGEPITIKGWLGLCLMSAGAFLIAR